jgi:hypothetical protein
LPAIWSAVATTANGISHSTGERYVRISRKATIPIVTSKSVMFAPSNAAVMSAENAGPPVTWTDSPDAGCSAIAVRNAFTCSAFSSARSVTVSGA